MGESVAIDSMQAERNGWTANILVGGCSFMHLFIIAIFGANRGQTKSAQSIFRSPVAWARPLGAFFINIRVSAREQPGSDKRYFCF